MATVRLVGVLLVVGLVVLLGVQNLAPTLPLVFFGGSTQALPLGVWLVGAIALGALTTLVSTALLGAVGGQSVNRSAAYKYRPQSFYEPADPSAGARAASDQWANTPPPYPPAGARTAGGSTAPRRDDSANDDPSWRAWTSLKSPGQWNDWEALSRAPKPETDPQPSSNPASVSGLVDGVTTWFSSSKQRAKQQQRVDESLQALDDDWGTMENRPYVAPGVSPVQDSLDDINQGWATDDPNRSFEASQAPRRVYRDGSIYSYSYRDDAPAPGGSGQIDNIYAPPDDAVYGDDDGDYASDRDYTSDYAADEAPYDSGAADDYDDRPEFDDMPLGEPAMAEDGVVDADYRVIDPPYVAAAEAAAADWAEPGERPATDDWDEADDALTP